MHKNLVHYDVEGNGWGAWYVDKIIKLKAIVDILHHFHVFTSST